MAFIHTSTKYIKIPWDFENFLEFWCTLMETIFSAANYFVLAWTEDKVQFASKTCLLWAQKPTLCAVLETLLSPAAWYSCWTSRHFLWAPVNVSHKFSNHLSQHFEHTQISVVGVCKKKHLLGVLAMLLLNCGSYSVPSLPKCYSYLIFVIFSPRSLFLAKIFSTQ